MSKKLVVNSSMVYGEVHAIPLDFVRALKEEPITFNYDCLYEMEPINRDDNKKGESEQEKIPFDTIKFNYKQRKLDKFLNYSLKKICYELIPVDEKVEAVDQKKVRRGLKNLKIIYTDEEGKEVILLDTSEGKMKENKETTIEFKDGEIIEEVIVYEGFKGLCGFSLTTNHIDKETNKEKYHLLGVNSENSTKILGKDSKDVAIGIGCWANEKYGVTGIYFYFVDKMTYSIFQTYGMRELRAKLKIKSDAEFIKNLENIREHLDDDAKLIYDICGSSDPVFFSVLNYLMPY